MSEIDSTMRRSNHSKCAINSRNFYRDLRDRINAVAGERRLTSEEVLNQAVENGLRYIEADGMTIPPGLKVREKVCYSCRNFRRDLRKQLESLATKHHVSQEAVLNEAVERGLPLMGHLHQLTPQHPDEAPSNALPAEDARGQQREAKSKGLRNWKAVDFDPHDSRLPSIPGIYVLFDRRKNATYVGQAGDVRKRMITHREKHWFRPPTVQLGTYVRIDDQELRQRVEALLIRFLNPVVNKQHADR